MRPTPVALIASIMLMLAISTAQADDAIILNQDSLQYTSLQSHMFDGIKLNESQRQQMRDLMQQVQQDSALISVSDVDYLHQLVTAEYFDENAVRNLMENINKRLLKRQIEMAKVRHRMYHILSTDQQEEVEKNYHQRVGRRHLLQ